MLFGLQQSERSCNQNVQRSWECEGRDAFSILQDSDVVMYLPQKIKGIDTSGGWNITQHIFIKRQTSYKLITVIESNHENIVHEVKPTVHYIASYQLNSIKRMCWHICMYNLRDLIIDICVTCEKQGCSYVISTISI